MCVFGQLGETDFIGDHLWCEPLALGRRPQHVHFISGFGGTARFAAQDGGAESPAYRLMFDLGFFDKIED